MRIAAIAGVLTLSVAAGGCMTTGYLVGTALRPVTEPTLYLLQAGVDAANPDYPETVLAHSGEPLSELVRWAHWGSWESLELARRMEHGLGVTRDPVCAYAIHAQNRNAYGLGIATRKGVARLKDDPAVAAYLTSGEEKSIAQCVDGAMASALVPQGND